MKITQHTVTLTDGESVTVDTPNGVNISNIEGLICIQDMETGQFIASFPINRVSSIIGVDEEKSRDNNARTIPPISCYFFRK